MQQRLVAAAAQLVDHGVGDPGALVGGDGDLPLWNGGVSSSSVVEERDLERELFAVGEKLAASFAALASPADEKAMDLASRTPSCAPRCSASSTSCPRAATSTTSRAT